MVWLVLVSYLIIIIIMEIYKAPTLRRKALNKHTHIMYIEMENVIKVLFLYRQDKDLCHIYSVSNVYLEGF